MAEIPKEQEAQIRQEAENKLKSLLEKDPQKLEGLDRAIGRVTIDGEKISVEGTREDGIDSAKAVKEVVTLSGLGDVLPKDNFKRAIEVVEFYRKIREDMRAEPTAEAGFLDALEEGDKDQVEAPVEIEKVWYDGVVSDLRKATDKDVQDDERNQAIQRLRDNGVSLPDIAKDPDGFPAAIETQGNKNRIKVASAVDFLEGETNNYWSSKEEAMKYLRDELHINTDDFLVEVHSQAEHNQAEQRVTPPVPPRENETRRRTPVSFDEELAEVATLTSPKVRLEAYASMRRDLVKNRPNGWAEKVQRLIDLEEVEDHGVPERDAFSREVEVNGEDWMHLRGSMIEVTANAGLNSEVDDVFNKVRQNFLSKKKITFGVLSPDIEAMAKVEIRARLELKQASLFWNRMKDDKNPEADAYSGMKSGLSNIPLLSESTYKWLMEENRNTSYVLRNAQGQPETTRCENLRQEMDEALKKIYGYISNENRGVGGDLWGVMTYDQRVELFKKLEINNFDVASLAFQLAEAECWTAMRTGSYHPARRLAYFSDYRIERFSKNLSVPGGLRLVQEYQDSHNGRLPYEVGADGKVSRIVDSGVFDEEGISLSRLGLDMSDRSRRAAEGEAYLRYLREVYARDDDEAKKVKRGQDNMRLDLSFGSMVYDAFDALGKPPVGLDALGKLKGSLFAWYIQRYGGNFGSGVSSLMLEYCKTYLWANSVANNSRNLDAGKILDLKKYYEETFLPVVDAFDPSTGAGAYIGLKPIVENEIKEDRTKAFGVYRLGGITKVVRETDRVYMNGKQQVEELVDWFSELLMYKCYPIVESARPDNSLQAARERGLRHTLPELPNHLIRADRNQTTLIKIKNESAGFKESLKSRIKSVVRDGTKWWNRR